MKKEIPCVIKDYWPDENHNSEDVIRQLILDDIGDIIEKTTFKKFTLTPFVSERVVIDDREEHTRRTPLRGKAPSHISPLELSKEDFENKVRTESSRVSYKDACDIHREITTRMMENRLYSYVDRWHHRIVYEEAAIHFYKLNSIKDMILVLEHSVEGTSVNLPTYQSGAV